MNFDGYQSLDVFIDTQGLMSFPLERISLNQLTVEFYGLSMN